MRMNGEAVAQRQSNGNRPPEERDPEAALAVAPV
jgi:hypothetical protein